MTFEEAKTRAFTKAFAAFFRCMRNLVGEDGIARLANGEPDDHLTFVSVGDGRLFRMRITIEYGPISFEPELEEILEAAPSA